MDIERVNFESLANGGDDVTGALMKLDQNCADIVGAVDSAGDGVGALAQRVTHVEESIEGLGDAAALDVGTAAGTVAAGNDARFLTAGVKNLLINGRLDIWQRNANTAYTVGGNNTFGFGADRWWMQAYSGPNGSGTATVSMNRLPFALGQTDVAGSPKYYARLQPIALPALGSSGGIVRTHYIVEEVAAVTGQHTFSIWLKADSARTIGVVLCQNFGSGGSAPVTAFQAKQDITAGWQRYSFTFTPPPLTGKILGSTSSYFSVELLLYMQDNATFPGSTIGPVGTYSTSAYLDFAMPQLERGGVATQHENRRVDDEMPRALRYCYRWDSAAAGGSAYCIGTALNGTLIARAVHKLPIPMRVPPVLSLSASGYILAGSSANGGTAVFNTNYTTQQQVEWDVVANGVTMTPGNAAWVMMPAGSYIIHDSEI